MKVKQKIIVTIKDTEFELSKEEAEELYNALRAVFGDDKVIDWTEYRKEPYTYPATPNYEITCETGGTGMGRNRRNPRPVSRRKNRRNDRQLEMFAARENN